MSIPVPLDELEACLVDFPWAYLVTTKDDGRVHALAVPTNFDGGVLVARVGRGAANNASARPGVTMLFPGTRGANMSLIIDGAAHVEGDRIEVTPTWAVLHRPALRTD